MAAVEDRGDVSGALSPGGSRADHAFASGLGPLMVQESGDAEPIRLPHVARWRGRI